MSADPNTDTRSPWYECFEPQEPEVVATALPAAAPATADTAADAASELDGAIDALFDYYNA